MRRYLDCPLAELHEPEFHELLQELGDAAGINHSEYSSLHFIPFLQLCLHPGGGGTKRIPLHLKRTRPGLLETRIEKIASPTIYELCEELATATHEELEMHINRKLMTFLNFIIRALEKKRPKPKRRR